MAQKLNLFVSYARADDRDFAANLYSRLREAGHCVWWDEQNMPSRGLTLLQEVREAIAAADRVVVVFGPGALTSDYVRSEWQFALNLSKPVTPLLRLGEYEDMPPELRVFLAPDARGSELSVAQWSTILRVLSEPPPALADLQAVPVLPPNFQPQTAAVTKLCAQLLRDQSEFASATPEQRVVTITGLPGSGKTVLASALARMTSVRRIFERIVWIAGGRRFDRAVASERLAELQKALGSPIESGALLIVLDDLWGLEAIEPFTEALGPRSRLVITTREAWIADTLASLHFTTSLFMAATGLALLGAWVDQDTSLLPAPARAVADYCENLPLALAMAGALAKSGISWADILEKLRQADLRTLGPGLPNYPYPSLAAAFRVSLNAVRDENAGAAALLATLVVFDPNVRISMLAIEAYARHRLNLTPVDVRMTMAFLTSRSLLAVGEGVITIHALLFDLLLLESKDERIAADKSVVTAFETLCKRTTHGGVDWCSVPRDPYIGRRLVRHLIGAGRLPDVAQLIGDARWPARKIEEHGITELVQDYEEYLAAAPHPEAAIRKFARVLGSAAHILRRDPSQYRTQMFMRMGADVDLSRQFAITASDLPSDVPIPQNPGIDVPATGLVAQWSERRGAVFSGEITSLGGRRVHLSGDSDGILLAADAGSGEVLYRIHAHQDELRALTISPSASLVATGSGEWLDVHSDCSIKVWNLKTGDHVVTLSACTFGEAKDANSHSQPIGDLQFSPDEKQLISAGWDGIARVWDVTTWQPVYTLQGHPQGLNTATACQDFIVTGSTDGSIGVWRRDSGALVRKQDLKSGPVAKLRAFPAGNRVACFSDTSIFMILDAGSGTPQFRTAFEDSQITGMHILSKERVRLAIQDGRILDVMVMEGAVEVITVVEQAVSIAHFLDSRFAVLSDGNHTFSYDLAQRTPSSPEDTVALGAVGMCPSTLQDIALVAGKSGQLAAYSVHDARRLAHVEHDVRVFSMHKTPEGLATRTHSECRWWTCSARGRGKGQNVRINEVRRESLPAFERDVAEQLSRHQVFGWLKDSWSLGTIHDLTTGAMRWKGMVSRPRELQAFLGHELGAPSIQGQYYSMCSVDYDNDRYLLYQNSLEGVLELAADAGNEGKITAALLLQQLPYARHAILSTLVPASNLYIEVSQFGLTLWDLETQTPLCKRPAERVEDAAVDLDAGLLTTIEGSFLRQYDTHTLRSICETPLTPFAINPRILASAPRGPIVVVDQDNNLHFLHPLRQKTWNRVGLDSPPIGCVLSGDGRSALITERRGRVSGFRL